MTPRRAASLLVLFIALLAHGVEAHEEHQLEALPAPSPRFDAPAPGSYLLPPIDAVAPHRLVDSRGESAPLRVPGRITFVSFVYLSCGEACPLATASFVELDRALAEREELHGAVELVTVSFDPARDTPVAMAQLREGLRPKGEWRFLTSRVAAEIAPVLLDFGQDAVAEIGTDGDWTGRLRHVLKVFLVDGEGRVRNIYSTGMLDVRLLVNDALSVHGESSGSASGAVLRPKVGAAPAPRVSAASPS